MIKHPLNTHIQCTQEHITLQTMTWAVQKYILEMYDAVDTYQFSLQSVKKCSRHLFPKLFNKKPPTNHSVTIIHPFKLHFQGYKFKEPNKNRTYHAECNLVVRLEIHVSLDTLLEANLIKLYLFPNI